ncbi:hypothetical protein CLOP_g3626 [Closterium sp. NIES-67]|nr:hypothetical protein CLOP_g3626 [Closterium sp. NIES-67]
MTWHQQEMRRRGIRLVSTAFLLVASFCAQTAGGAGGSIGGSIGRRVGGRVGASRRGLAHFVPTEGAPPRAPLRFYPTMTAPTGQNVPRGVSLPKTYYTSTPQSANVTGAATNASIPSDSNAGNATGGSRSGATAAAAGITTLKPFASPIGISPRWGSWQCQNSAYCGVMYAPIAVYIIWYGKFSSTQKAMVRALTRSFNPSSDDSITAPLWWNINRLYYDRKGRFISSSVTVADETDDTGYSRGASLTDDEVNSLVTSAISSRKLPYDADGVYFVLSDETVSQSAQGSSFCTHFCGWHSYTDVSGKGRAITSWVGNAKSKCPGSCITSLISSSSASPNRDKGMDGLLSVYAHELAEATSSPFLLTWMDDKGEENADKCGWKFGTTKRDSSNAPYNLVGVDGYNFMIQQNWDLTKGKCATTVPYPGSSSSSPPSKKSPPPSDSPPPPPPPPLSTGTGLIEFLQFLWKLFFGSNNQRPQPPSPPS